MRPLIFLAAMTCGAVPDGGDPVIAKVYDSPSYHAAFSINGTLPDGGWYPTGIAFDARPEGWRVSCLNGVTPRFEPGDNGAMRVFCGWPAEGAP